MNKPKKHPLQRNQLIKVALTVFLLVSSYLAYSTQLIHMNVNNDKNQLVLDVLKLALSKSEEKFEYVGIKNPNANLIRNKELLLAGELSVIWAGTSRNLESVLLPIKIPVLKGLLGHRIFIIRKEDQEKFDRITSLNDLKKLVAGQGTFWEDSIILKNNHVPLVTTNKFQNLFPMLAGKRFDYFPRALHEPWVELTDYQQLNLVVEKKILLIYPLAMYFFVSPENIQLAKQIERGLNLAIVDGSYDQLFYSNPMIKNALKKSNLKDRVILRLLHSNMSGASEKLNKYWLDILHLGNNQQ